MASGRFHGLPAVSPRSGRNATAWIDLASPPHPFLFASIVDGLEGLSVTATVRQKTETVALARDVGFDAEVLGRDYDNPTLRKFGIPLRTARLAVQAPRADVALSSRNAMCILASKARGIPSIHFTDNDITAHVDGLTAEKLYNRFEAAATHSVVPAAFETEELTRWGASPESIHTYEGYKEDVSVASFDPDPAFTDGFPFDDYIVVRPEAHSAAYVDDEPSIVPDLLTEAVEREINVVYLPRGRPEEMADDRRPRDDRIFVPPEPLDGLQLAWHARCVLTGSGTMAREAACMGKPAVSFFPNTLLSVDQALIEEGRLNHSRDVDEIIEYVDTLADSQIAPDRSRAFRVREEVVELTRTLIESVSPEYATVKA